MKIRDVKFKISILMQMAKISNCEEDKAKYLKEIEKLLQNMDEVDFQCRQILDGITFDENSIEKIKKYLLTRNRVCAIEIWQEALNETGRPTKWQATEINDIVMSTGEWKKMTNPYKTVKYGSQRGLQKSQKK